jgi:biopolymer transport protein ExbD
VDNGLISSGRIGGDVIMLKKKKSRVLNDGSGGDVNITSLMDVLTVLLFFLIMNASVAPVEIQTPEGITLPTSSIEMVPKTAIKLALTPSALIVNDKVILKLQNGRFPASELEQDERIVKALKTELNKEYKKTEDFFKEVADQDAGLLPTPPLLIQADKDTPFGTLKVILHTAAASGFGDFQFVVNSNPE